MSDVLRSCEMKTQISKEDGKWLRGLTSYLKFATNHGEDEVMETNMDLRYFTGMGQEGERLL